MAYCNLTTDLELRGSTFDNNASLTSFGTTKLTAFQEIIEDEIHAKLFKAGIAVPIVQATNPYAFRRLKYLEALGINMMMEQAQYTRSQPMLGIEVENTSKIFRLEFEKKLAEYCDDPEFTLFQGETNIDALNERRNKRPIGRMLYSEVSELIENDSYDPEFTINYEW